MDNWTKGREKIKRPTGDGRPPDGFWPARAAAGRKLMAQTVDGHVTPVDQWGARARNNRALYVARM